MPEDKNKEEHNLVSPQMVESFNINSINPTLLSDVLEELAHLGIRTVQKVATLSDVVRDAKDLAPAFLSLRTLLPAFKVYTERHPMLIPGAAAAYATEEELNNPYTPKSNLLPTMIAAALIGHGVQRVIPETPGLLKSMVKSGAFINKFLECDNRT